MNDVATETREKIRLFLLEKLEPRGITEVSDDESLVEKGVADSLGVLQLVAFLEETFPITIGDHEILQENFITVDAMVRFVTAKRQPPSAQT